jgi:molybdopterin biosynthesis enzyme
MEVRSGDGITPAGGIAAPGDILARAGTRLSFVLAMSCTACGVMDVMVRRPVADIIFNSAGLTRRNDRWAGLISAAIRGSGAQIGSVQFTAGDQALLAEALLASSADLVAVIGGTGHGPGDTTMVAIAEAGEAIFHGVRLSPGATMGFGIVGGRPVFASPGGLADMVTANIVMSWHFVRRVFGRPQTEPQLLRGRLTDAVPASPDRSRLVFARLVNGQVTPFVGDAPTPGVLAASNCSIFVPEGARRRRAGEHVEVLRMGASM